MTPLYIGVRLQTYLIHLILLIHLNFSRKLIRSVSLPNPSLFSPIRSGYFGGPAYSYNNGQSTRAELGCIYKKGKLDSKSNMCFAIAYSLLIETPLFLINISAGSINKSRAACDRVIRNKGRRWKRVS